MKTETIKGRVVITVEPDEADDMARAMRFLTADLQSRSWACNGGKSRELRQLASQLLNRAARISTAANIARGKS